MKLKPTSIRLIIPVLLAAALFASYIFHFRFDLTSDKRYSISAPTKQLMQNIESPITATIYLDGDLNPGFQRLKKATGELIDELSIYANHRIEVNYTNPSQSETAKERDARYEELYKKGMTPTNIYEKDKEGKVIQKMIFPWLEIKYKNQSRTICLLRNLRHASGSENLNMSIENLEFIITDGIRQITNNEVSKIAFIEGHGELNEAETYDISKALSHYFQIDRGVIAKDPAILNPYKAIIIAKPTQPFSETDKFIIDQYIMRGGRVLWLLDGVRIARENLSKNGISPAIALDLNLNDQLFKYGIRINPVILQDVQCTSVPINIAPAKETPQFEPSPWFFSPLLLTSPNHPITRNLPEVKAEFCSGIDLVGENKNVTNQILLATSNNSHVIGTPSPIDLSSLPQPNDKNYFNVGFLPVAVLLEGKFESDFANRMMPEGIASPKAILNGSESTRQIFIADGDIIRNETNGIASDSTTLPLGFDRYMNQQFGNKEFIVNSVLYLTDNDGWMQLRNRTVQLRLLNKEISANDQLFWKIINVLIPLLLLLLGGIIFYFFRKRSYTRH